MPVCQICGQKTVSVYLIEYNRPVCKSCMQRAGLLTDRGIVNLHRCNQLFGGKPTVYEIKQYLNALDNRKNKITDGFMSEDEMLDMAIEVVIAERQASTSLLQRKLKLGYARASRIMDMMEEIDIIGPYEGSKPRQVLISWSEWNIMKKQRFSEAEVDYPHIDDMEDYELEDIDGMEGHEFEYFCAEILRKNGFCEVQVTPGSGDQGADIVAVKEGVRYAIQCKNYASALSNTPIQEVHAAKSYYQCHVAVVMTNSTFTPSAESLAEATGVLLWDGDEVKRLMKKGGMAKPIEKKVDASIEAIEETFEDKIVVEEPSNSITVEQSQHINQEAWPEIEEKEDDELYVPKEQQDKHIRVRWVMAILSFQNAVIALVNLSIEETSRYMIGFFAILAMLFGVLAFSPKDKPFVFGLDKGISKTTFVWLCVVAAFFMPLLETLLM